jgi:hypothetical protein
MARNSRGDMSDDADRLFSDAVLSADRGFNEPALSGDRLLGDALFSRAFLFATFFGAVFDFGKAPNQFGKG